jgi:stearoyl-CoA desaturase (Delta-9 desaturase)
MKETPVAEASETSVVAPVISPDVTRVSPKKGKPLWANILFMTITPALALILVPAHIYFYGFSWGLMALLAVTYVISNMSITCGYHRYFSHRSYNAHPFIEFLYIFFGAGAFQSSILQWCTDHRRHHREVDSHEDPYTINEGFLYAHLTWMFFEDLHPESKQFPKDLTKNRLIVLQHKYYVWIASFVGFVLPGLVAWALGLTFWGGVIFGGLLRIVLSQHSTFLINSAAHTFGKQTYTDKHSARDSVIMAFLTFGEGYHNFHHSFQADYRNGTRWYHWDPTKWWIRGLAFLGLASKLKRAQHEEILKARIAMEERQLLSKGANSERLTQLKAQIFEAQQKLKALRETYMKSKLEAKSQREIRWKEVKRLLRAELRIAEIEFKSAYRQWRTFHKAAKRTASAA